jgi:hypothetical protein
VAADLPKLVLKHAAAFLVADRRGDFPAMPGTEFGFYTGGTRFSTSWSSVFTINTYSF